MSPNFISCDVCTSLIVESRLRKTLSKHQSSKHHTCSITSKCCLIIKCCAYANIWDSPLGPQSTSPSGSSDAQEGGGVRPRTASMDKQALQVLMPSFSRGHARHGGVRGNANPSIRTSNITINYYY